MYTYFSFYELPFLIWISSEKSSSAAFCVQTVPYFLGKNFRVSPLLQSSKESQRSIYDKISTSRQETDGNQANRSMCRIQPTMDSRNVSYHHHVALRILESIPKNLKPFELLSLANWNHAFLWISIKDIRILIAKQTHKTLGMSAIALQHYH